MKESKKISLTQLLNLNKFISDELKNRNLIRTNNITGDLGESLFKTAFNWKLENNSNFGYDATDTKGIKYQIKTRRSDKNIIQFGAIRDIEKESFDYLALLVFSEDYSIRYACLIPLNTVKRFCKHQEYTNSELPIFNISLLRNEPDIQDVTEILQNTFNTL